MTRLQTLACRALGVLIAMSVPAAAAPLSSATFDAQAFAQRVERGMAASQIPGLGVAVIEAGEVVFARGFGATAPGGEPVGTQTYFINASTTKAMVAAGLLLLVDEGRLSLDDPVIKYLPEIHFGDPALTPQVTLRDLLTHRTGLPSTDFWTFNQGMPLSDQLPRLQAVEPVAAPRSRKIYQNTMYELVGLVIDRVAGTPWPEFLAERLWRPIGMGTVATRDAIPAEAARVEPFELFNDEPRRVNHSLRGPVSDAAGSAWSTIDDMVLWLQFLLRDGVTASGERLLSKAAMEEMFSPQQLVRVNDYYPTATLTRPHWISYGLGWYQQDFQGRKIDYHTGSLNGATAIAGLDRGGNRAVVMLANLGGAELRHALLWDTMDLDPAAQRRDWVSDVLALYDARRAAGDLARAEIRAGRLDRPPSLPLAAYTGSFDSPRGGPLRIVRDGETLILSTQVRNYRLVPWHAEVFQLMHEDWEHPAFASFTLTPAGRINGLEAFGMRFDREEVSESR